jgi:hypothetical protein
MNCSDFTRSSRVGPTRRNDGVNKGREERSGMHILTTLLRSSPMMRIFGLKRKRKEIERAKKYIKKIK